MEKRTTKNKIKKISGPITGNQFGVVLEKMNSNIELVLEGHVALDKKIDDFKEEMMEFKHDTENNFQTLFEFKRDTESNFKAVFKYLSSIDDELKSIKSDIADIRKTLSQKADLERVARLEERVAMLERRLSAAR